VGGGRGVGGVGEEQRRLGVDSLRGEVEVVTAMRRTWLPKKITRTTCGQTSEGGRQKGRTLQRYFEGKEKKGHREEGGKPGHTNLKG